jgi:hypothetical protein
MPVDPDKAQAFSKGFNEQNNQGLLQGIKNYFAPDQSNSSNPSDGALSSALQKKRAKLSQTKGVTGKNDDDDEATTGLE